MHLKRSHDRCLMVNFLLLLFSTAAPAASAACWIGRSSSSVLIASMSKSKSFSKYALILGSSAAIVGLKRCADPSVNRCFFMI